IRTAMDAGIDHALAGQLQRADPLPLREVLAGEMRDGAGNAAPVIRHAGDVAEEHVILPLGKDHLRRPMRVEPLVARRIQPLDRAAIMPAGPAIHAHRQSDGGAVDPGELGALGPRPAIGVEHPPFVTALAAHHHRVRRAIFYRITKYGCAHAPSYTRTPRPSALSTSRPDWPMLSLAASTMPGSVESLPAPASSVDNTEALSSRE